jgi:hypothetical protein
MLSPHAIVYSTDPKRCSNNALCKLENDGSLDNTAVVEVCIDAPEPARISLMCTSPCSNWLGIYMGVVRRGASLDVFHGHPTSSDGWFLSSDGHLCGNGHITDGHSERIGSGDVVTMELHDGTLRYWVNGVLRTSSQHTHVQYPVQWAVTMLHEASVVQIVTT